ncbi:hypothetical protein ACLB1E_22300 [Escherichia coli]
MCKAHLPYLVLILIKLPIITIALVLGMLQKRQRIAAIALNPQTPDFNNTILHWNKAENYLPALPASFL